MSGRKQRTSVTNWYSTWCEIHFGVPQGFVLLINSDTNPSPPHYQRCLQVSETVPWHKLRGCYSVNILQRWVRWRGLIYFWKMDHSRISRSFSRNWLGLNNFVRYGRNYDRLLHYFFAILQLTSQQLLTM